MIIEIEKIITLQIFEKHILPGPSSILKQQFDAKLCILSEI